MKQAQNQMVKLEEFAAVCRERDALQKELVTAMTEIEGQKTLLDLQRASCEESLKARDKARQEADYLRKDYQEQIRAQEEVIERLKAQNSRFVEEHREAKQRAASLAADLARAREEVVRLVRLCDDFRDRLDRVTQEKNDVVKISNGFARERDEIRADYDARGKVIKKLRKRLHKLKKKLKH